MESYPVFPRDGQEMEAFPRFWWQPYPEAGATYRFEIFETFPNGSGGFAPLDEPLLEARGLLAPFYMLPPGHPIVRTGMAYAWRVTAELPDRRVQGRPVVATGFGVVGAGTTGAGPLPLTASLEAWMATEQPYAATNWASLLEKLNELARQKEMIARAIAGNPLVEEVELIRQLANLLKNPPETIEELKALKEEFEDEAGDPLGYITRLLKDKLIEKLEKMLAKKIGEKAAEAIISIISDLVNFGDLVVQLLRLESLCTEYNRLLLEGIARDPTGATVPNVLFILPEQFPPRGDRGALSHPRACHVTQAARACAWVAARAACSRPHRS